jgi:hypothetical protein
MIRIGKIINGSKRGIITKTHSCGKILENNLGHSKGLKI